PGTRVPARGIAVTFTVATPHYPQNRQPWLPVFYLRNNSIAHSTGQQMTDQSARVIPIMVFAIQPEPGEILIPS
ncbi:MAG: hypothetical protein ACRC04_11010, partial [Aeromonas veronii]